MLTLTVMTILIVLFVVLAVKNWTRTIGAGPTILIIGAIVVSAYIPVKWSDYQQRLREYDVCVAKVERTTEINIFNMALIHIIAREWPERVDIVEELTALTARDQTVKTDCPEEPTFTKTFLNNFNSGGS
jgi:hypothetical protein